MASAVPRTESGKLADKLLDAAANGRLKSVQLTLSLVGRGNKPLVDVNVRDARGRSSLHLACALVTESESSAQIVSYLIKTGAELDITDARGRTPLHVAVETANILSRTQGEASGRRALDVVGLLLDSGATVDMAFDGGVTALALATRDGNEAACRLLLEHGARADGGWTPDGLLAAAASRIPQKAAGASPMSTRAGRLRQSLAPVLHKFGIADEIGVASDGEIAAHNEVPRPARSPLQWAVCGANADILAMLLCAPGAELAVNELFPQHDAERGRRALHVAARLTQVRITEMLLRSNAHLDARDDAGCTPYELLTNTQYPPHKQKDREAVRQLLLDHSEGRVLAGGGEVRTLSEQAAFVLGVLLMYADTFSNAYIAIWVFNPRVNPKGQAVAWMFALTLLAIFMPNCMYALAQARQREKTPVEFRMCMLRTLFFVEPAYEAWQSLTHGDKTTGYTSVELLHCIFESIPSSVLQLYALFRDWSDYDLSHAPEPLNPEPGVAIVSSVALALFLTLLASTNLAMENDDSAWREALVGHSTPLLGSYKGRVLASLYFLGDGFYHIGALAIVAYALRWWGFIVFLCLFFIHFRLLCQSIESQSRAFVVAPLMVFVDFPLRSDKRARGLGGAHDTTKHCNEIVVRAASASTIVLWAAVLASALLPGKVPTGGVGADADTRVHELPAFRTYQLPYRGKDGGLWYQERTASEKTMRDARLQKWSSWKGVVIRISNTTPIRRG